MRQAILDANADASTDDVTIVFNLPGAGVQTIAPLSVLPTITRPVTIDGYTQPVASSNTLADADICVAATPAPATPTRFYRLHLP